MGYLEARSRLEGQANGIGIFLQSRFSNFLRKIGNLKYFTVVIGVLIAF